MKNSKIVPVIMMGIIVFLMGLAEVTAQTATADVSDCLTFDEEENRYVSSRSGEMDNPYSTIKIVEDNDLLTFIFYYKKNNACKASQYKIIKRKRNSDILIARRTGDNAKIRIDQSKEGRMQIQCNHKEKPSRYDGAFILTNVKFL